MFTTAYLAACAQWCGLCYCSPARQNSSSSSSSSSRHAVRRAPSTKHCWSYSNVSDMGGGLFAQGSASRGYRERGTPTAAAAAVVVLCGGHPVPSMAGATGYRYRNSPWCVRLHLKPSPIGSPIHPGAEGTSMFGVGARNPTQVLGP